MEYITPLYQTKNIRGVEEMTKSYRLILVLTATAVLSGLLLSFLNLHTSPLIEAHQNKVLNDALSSVLPGCDKIEEQFYENKQFYFGYDTGKNVKGIAFLTEGNGFQSKLRILVGMNASLTQIVKIRILEQKETPGLGTKIETDPSSKTNPEWFPNQFDGLNISNKISYVKNQTPDKSAGEIMAITGATISSKAVIDIINAALLENNRILKENTDLNIGECPAIDAVNETVFDPQLIPEGAEIVAIDNKTYFLNKDENGLVTGVAFIASGEGFQSTIKVLACMNPDFSKISVMSVYIPAEPSEMIILLEVDSRIDSITASAIIGWVVILLVLSETVSRLGFTMTKFFFSISL